MANYGELSQFTNEQLSSFTHEQLNRLTDNELVELSKIKVKNIEKSNKKLSGLLSEVTALIIADMASHEIENIDWHSVLVCFCSFLDKLS